MEIMEIMLSFQHVREKLCSKQLCNNIDESSFKIPKVIFFFFIGKTTSY